MKSKSFTQDQSEHKNKSKLSKSMDFTKLYKSASDTSTINAENNQKTPVVFKKAKVKKDKDSLALEGATSTPISNAKFYSTQPKVKPIIKNSSSYESSAETPDHEISFNASMRKKRNKSVSFRLDDESESAVKKAKSDVENSETSQKNLIQKKLKFKKAKAHYEKENTTQANQIQPKEKWSKKNKKPKKDVENNIALEVAGQEDNNVVKQANYEKANVTQANQLQLKEKWSKKNKKPKKDVENNSNSNTDKEVASQEDNNVVKKKHKNKKNKSTKENHVVDDAPQVNIETAEHINKKKKKKKSPKPIIEGATNTDYPQEEPGKKNKNKQEKPQTNKADAPEIAEDLKNLNIGDNAHTLTNLLDDMSVADKSTKNKSKNPKQKLGKMKRKKTNSTSSTESLTVEKLDEEKKEKVKWQKRKWNKDSKSGVVEVHYSKTVIVENIPLSLMLNYKKVLLDHFKSCGFIKEIGLAEVYPSEDTKPVFTTTISFGDSGAVLKALEEDNCLVENHRIRVKRPLPPTQTTIVVKSYGEMTEQALSSAFNGAGKIRSIRPVVKGKNTIGTAFVEFDGPEAVERAIKMAAETKIGGKKIYPSKFEIRGAKKKRFAEKEAKSVKQSDSESE